VKHQFDLPQEHPEDWTVPAIMATVGPTLESTRDLRRAIEAGARWFRLPCGYRQRPHVENARAVLAAAAAAGIEVHLLLDLPSSRPRTGAMDELRLNQGDHVLFWDPETSPSGVSKNGVVKVPLPGLTNLLAKLVPQQRMWFCDGRLSFVVDELRDSCVFARMVQGSVPLKASNSLFLPDSPSAFSPLTDADSSLLKAFVAQDLYPDWIALSLIASPDDVREARAEVRRLLGSNAKIMAKFETVAAVECADEIIDESDGSMVARGDLGLAVGYIRLPEVQERLVQLARRANRISVVATQVMEGFAETGLPQRAELSDLSLIARQRADVVMLGKETVFSPRPIDCIRLARELLTYETWRFEQAARPRKRSQRPKQQAVVQP
jgi:pyruvate kinase